MHATFMAGTTGFHLMSGLSAPRRDGKTGTAASITPRSMLIKRRPTSIATAWLDLAQSSRELMQGSAAVIARRTAAMAKAGAHPSAADDREMKRMVDEKVDATAASLAEMALAATASYQSLWLGSLLAGRTPSTAQLQRAATRVLGAGMAPYQKAVRSNLKRLRK